MGACCSSDKEEDSFYGGVTELEGLDEAKSLPGGRKKGRNSVVRYRSDVGSQRSSIISSLVKTNSTGRVEAAYDVASGAVLGRGACGAVCAVRRLSDDSMFAMKTMKLDSHTTWAELQKEIEIQKALDHPNIVRIYEAFSDSENSSVHIIMELCTGGSLVSRLRHHASGFNEKAAAKLIKKMLSAVTYCHKHGVVRAAARVPIPPPSRGARPRPAAPPHPTPARRRPPPPSDPPRHQAGQLHL